MDINTQNKEAENLAQIYDTAQKILALLEPLDLPAQVAALGLADTLGAYIAATRSQVELDALTQKPSAPILQLGQAESLSKIAKIRPADSAAIFPAEVERVGD